MAPLIAVLGLVLHVLIVIEQGLGERHAHEEPREALEFPGAVGVGAGLIVEEQAAVGAHGRDARAGRKHDNVGLLILRQEHLRSGGSRDEHFIAWAHVVDVVRADAAVNLLVREDRAGLVGLVLANLTVSIRAVHLHHPLHAEGHGLRGLVVAHCGGGNGVEADLCGGLALLVRSRRDDADGLALNVGDFAVMVEGDMAGLPIGIAGVLSQRLGVHVVRHHLPDIGSLGAKYVPWDFLALHHPHALLLHGSGAAGHRRCHGARAQCRHCCRDKDGRRPCGWLPSGHRSAKPGRAEELRSRCRGRGGRSQSEGPPGAPADEAEPHRTEKRRLEGETERRHLLEA
mmetsp:Transcript_29191/g.60649  ORF Transcript_29191/g.60649 Transcript_29191/m.60649 type:complete len:343 (+) Transcript_29191:344-1372(+)